MSWYDWFLTGHILFAVVWVGGGSVIAVLGTMTVREDDPARLALFGRRAAWVGERVFTPASVLVLLFGIGLMLNGESPWEWDMTWVQIALAGWLLTALVGILYLGPTAKRLAKALEERGPEDADVQTMLRRIMLVDRIDVTVLLIVVFVMAAKPWS